MSDEAGAHGDPGWRRREKIRLARERIRSWPREEREALARMELAEVGLIVEAVAELDIRPGSPEGCPQDVIEIDLR